MLALWLRVVAASEWWCVEGSFWVGDRDLYLPGDVLWFWGWHCLAYSSWRFLNMLLHRCLQVFFPEGLGAFLPRCCQRITRLPEWSSGLLEPCFNGIICTWTELNGVAPATCKEWGSQHPGRANCGYFQCILLNTVKWESVMEKPWKERKCGWCWPLGFDHAAQQELVLLPPGKQYQWKHWVMNSAAAMNSEDK